VIYGLTAALGWGTGDFLAALSSRHIGLRRTAVVSQVCAVAGLAAVGLVLGERWAAPVSGLPAIIGVGVLLTAAYVLLYRGLQLGPVALVSPLAAANSAVTVVLAVVVLNEILGWPAEVALVVTIAGVILASIPATRTEHPVPAGRSGTTFGLAACAALGAFSFCLATLARRYGWFPTVFDTHVVGAVIFVSWYAAGRLPKRGPGAAALLPAVAIGLLDAVAVSAFAKGVQVGSVSVVAAVASAFPLVPIVCGLLILRERPRRIQVAGAVLVVAGLIALGALA
jgi:drug/metabolite transporter (DMT)-like permease